MNHHPEPGVIVSDQVISIMIFFQGDSISEVRLADHPLPSHCEPGRAEIYAAFAGYLEDSRPLPSLPVQLSRLTVFQRQVLTSLPSIPPGSTLTYQTLAEQLGLPRHCRAVARALAANPFPLIFPCHRIVARHGWGGFSAPGGVQTKQYLLNLEKKVLPHES